MQIDFKKLRQNAEKFKKKKVDLTKTIEIYRVFEAVYGFTSLSELAKAGIDFTQITQSAIEEAITCFVNYECIETINDGGCLP